MDPVLTSENHERKSDESSYQRVRPNLRNPAPKSDLFSAIREGIKLRKADEVEIQNAKKISESKPPVGANPMMAELFKKMSSIRTVLAIDMPDDDSWEEDQGAEEISCSM